MSGLTTALEGYRNSPDEIVRTRDLMAIVSKNLSTVLDIGVWDWSTFNTETNNALAGDYPDQPTISFCGYTVAPLF